MHGFGDCFFIVFWGLICDGKAENYMYIGKTMQTIIFFIKSTFRNQYIKLHGPTTTVYGHSANFCLTRKMAWKLRNRGIFFLMALPACGSFAVRMEDLK